MRESNYNKKPVVAVDDHSGSVCRGWSQIGMQLQRAIGVTRPVGAPVIAIECYVGVSAQDIAKALQEYFPEALWVDPTVSRLADEEIDHLVAPFVGGNDPIFGVIANLELGAFFSPAKIEAVRAEIAAAERPVFVIGTGALVLTRHPDILIYADLPRWEAQLRHRRGSTISLGGTHTPGSASLKYKRAFFIDWRVCDRLKKASLAGWNFLLDTTNPDDPKLVSGADLRRALADCAAQPFRVVPFFDPGPWGGQWMKEVCGLDPDQANYAWCFDCVPEENSLILGFGDVEIEIPSINLVFAQPEALLGGPVYGRFGAEFPIRFDFLDTMDGGNLSLQVHPLTEYIQNHFGIHYTQDESYYLLDAKADAKVYLGCKDGIDPPTMMARLDAAQRGEAPFNADDFVASFPAKAHDHFLIPAGTIHCSGRNAMVLEISATPYIFTFKLWDWGRMGMDGLPRPINIARGAANICWNRTESFAAAHLVNQVTPIASGEGWREERTGLHEAEFIETRRHWFTNTVTHDTGGREKGGVQVLNLVVGEEAIVESPTDAFKPFVVHYAETFIIPAAVGPYLIRPHGRSIGKECATIKAFVRCPA
jgi:mannose-6-phosphate isomerase class I